VTVIREMHDFKWVCKYVNLLKSVKLWVILLCQCYFVSERVQSLSVVLLQCKDISWNNVKIHLILMLIENLSIYYGSLHARWAIFPSLFERSFSLTVCDVHMSRCFLKSSLYTMAWNNFNYLTLNFIDCTLS
jgi:hypothetical protein